MEKFIYSSIINGIIAQTGALTTTDQIVETDESGYITGTLAERLDVLLQSIPQSNTLITTSNFANNLRSNLKTINNTEIVGTGNISIQGGSGSASDVVADYDSGLKIGSVNGTDLYVPNASVSRSGVISSSEYSKTYGNPYVKYIEGAITYNTSLNDYTIHIFRDSGANLDRAVTKVFILTISGGKYVVTANLIRWWGSASYDFILEGPITYNENSDMFAIDRNEVYRKYFVSHPANGERTAVLIYPNDIFAYDTDTNTLSITTE